MKLAYGTDEEYLTGSCEYDTFEEAFEEALLECDPEVGDTIYIAEVHPYVPKYCAEQLIESLNEDAYEKCGDHVDCWPDVTKEQTQSLQVKLDKLINSWITETKQRKLWTCGKSKDFLITEEHIKEIK